jgi:hypothetical protein
MQINRILDVIHKILDSISKIKNLCHCEPFFGEAILFLKKDCFVVLKNRTSRNDKRFVLEIWILLFGICITGCSPQHPKSYSESTLITYAELTLLYEKEKMVNKQTDSTYKVKVKDFFASKSLQQDEFKKQIETISQDDEEWKIFIQDVSTAMDSLKNVGIAK